MTALPEQPERILIIKPSALGDLVTAMPVLRGLRRAFPKAKIDWLVSSHLAPLIEGDRDLSGLVLFDRKALGSWWRSASSMKSLRSLLAALGGGRYDWAIDLQGLLRSGLFTRATRAAVRAGFADAREGAPCFYNRPVAVGALHTVDRNIELLAALGPTARPQDMTLTPTPAGVQYAADFCRGERIAPRKFIVCVPSTRWVTKVYPAHHWRQVAAALGQETHVVLLGAREDRGVADVIAENQPRTVVNLVGLTDIPQMVGLIAASGGVVCSDSAAKFIAPAVGVDCATLIGPTQVARTGPYLRGRAIVAPVPCQGCLKKCCRHITCMESIPPAAVIAAAREMLAAAGA